MNQDKSIQEKNIAIAEMLGAEKEQWYPPNKDNDSTGVYYKFPRDIALRMGLATLQVGDYELRFHTDANWQYECLEYLYKNMYISYRIENCHCWIWDSTNENMIPVSIYLNDTKLSVFEALYQFSQYLKQKS